MKEESSDYPVAHVAGGTVGGVSLGLTIAVVAFVVFMKLRQQRPGLCYFQACNQNSAARGAMIFLGGAITYNKFSYGQLKYNL